MIRVIVVRCPTCGATDAGATDYIYELTQMTCGECGYQELADSYEIKEEWNVELWLPPGTGLPRFVEPRVRREAPGVRGDDGAPPRARRRRKGTDPTLH